MEHDLIAHRYKPLFSRARGGFSDVIIAWDTKLARRVAIKRILTDKNLPVASLEEARTTALLSSPNIVSVYDFEHTGGETLIIMENVDGPSLAELMAGSRELLDIDVATTILEGVVAALEYAHENQVLHLDIKPANILIDQNGHIKVSDFGLAELAGAEGFGEVQGGTIGYMPPEQLKGEPVDERADLWALAALSYQLLTGANPFFALSPRESLEQIRAEQYALPSELRPALDGGVDEALINALGASRDVRPDSVADFWLELRPHLGKIGPGRRRLKSLARAWMGKEVALLEGAGESSFSETASRAILREAGEPDNSESEAARTGEGEAENDLDSPDSVSLWNGDDEDADDEYQDEEEARRQRRAERREAREARGPITPLWQRLGARSQSFLSRVVSALAAASMAWIALSALPYLSEPLAQAATVAATSTGSATPALMDTAFAARLALMAVCAITAFIAPRVGAALATLCLVLGFFFTGNWLVGILVLAGCSAWWAGIGRQSAADATIFTLSPLLAVLGLPMLLPLLAGYFQSWRRALGTTVLGCFVCSLLSLTTAGASSNTGGAFFASLLGFGGSSPDIPALYGRLSTLPLEELLGATPSLVQMPSANELFIPLISLFALPEFWLILASWLIASVVMSLLIRGKSRVKYSLATLCGTGIVAAGYVPSLVLSVGADSLELLAATILRLVLALAICLLLIVLGVQPGPALGKGKGRAR
ncbi:MAG: serine/threonine protein kinase [Coriobacteriales bacterium]|jgi:serine/threonine protein kinase|nr:serine/threonine protein kinase [Coriobacteriales bacterium]